MTKLFNFFSEAFTELKDHMTWPTWAETQKQTIIVALFSIIMALVTWGVDETFTRVVAGFFSLIK